MNILVIFTGGTIGSVVSSGFIAPDRSAPYVLLEKYREVLGNDVNFETDSPYELLSENLDGSYLNKLISCVKSHLDDDLEGIIITHGTDTLQYTSAALGLIFNTCQLPIVLVSSNYILEDSRANGMANFEKAVFFIKQKAGKGVFISYRNGQGDTACHMIHNGLFLMPHLPYQDNLYSLDDNYYGSFEEDTFFKNNNYRNIQKDQLIMQPQDNNGIALSKISPVLYVSAYPGQCYPALNDNIKAVLLSGYHSGTLCTAGNELASFVSCASRMNIPVYLTGVEDRTQYESTKKYDSLGIKVLPKLSPVTAYMMLWLYYSI